MMRSKAFLRPASAFVLLALLVFGLSEARSQQEPRRRPSRRVTNPVRPQPTPAADEPALISTAEEQSNADGEATGTPPPGRTRRGNRSDAEPPGQTRETLDRLASELTRLNRKVDEMEKQRRSDLVQERLTRAEQRAEGLQQQLRDVLEKEANMQARTDQLDEQLRPENLERQTALAGSFRPDDVRDALRRQLENEKRRVQAQLEVLTASRTRLETALANADSIVQRLRTQLDEETRKELEAEGSSDGSSTPAPAPSATPPPPAQ